MTNEYSYDVDEGTDRDVTQPQVGDPPAPDAKTEATAGSSVEEKWHRGSRQAVQSERGNSSNRSSFESGSTYCSHSWTSGSP